MAITADLVKKLRERTNAGMMECKEALVEANGDIDLAAENMRKKGQAQADKKAGRITAEGRIVLLVSKDKKTGVILETNCETDFVAKEEKFRNFGDQVAARILEEKIQDLEMLKTLTYQKGESQTVEEIRQNLVATLGENLQIRRFKLTNSEGMISSYLHGERIGVLVNLSNHNETLGKDIAMHIAASRPRAVSAEDIPEDLIANERKIFLAQAQESGKPDDIVRKMVEGRIKKFLSEESLLGQPFVKDPSITVEDLLAKTNTKVISFERFEVGEGIERKVDNFAAEVMAQVRGSL